MLVEYFDKLYKRSLVGKIEEIKKAQSLSLNYE